MRQLGGWWCVASKGAVSIYCILQTEIELELIKRMHKRGQGRTKGMHATGTTTVLLLTTETRFKHTKKRIKEK
jgi:hypothetical protein